MRRQVVTAFVVFWVLWAVLVAITTDDRAPSLLVSARTAASLIFTLLFGYLFVTRGRKSN